MNKEALNKVSDYYSEKISSFGATSKGVDWNGEESHFLRFEQLCKVLPKREKFSLMDYGCGFGALIDFLNEKEYLYNYYGFDISEDMINQAKTSYKSNNISFSSTLPEDCYDYTIANGIFNVKLDLSVEKWKNHIENTLLEINKISSKGFSFNILTSYSDEEHKKEYLYYADPLYFFDYCNKHFSKNVALLHDYNLYEFTIIVKK